MKKITMVLPLAVLLAYCSGPNNTQKTTDTDMDGTSTSVSANTTGTATDVSDATATDNTAATASSSSTSTTDNTSSNGSVSGSNTTNMDTLDPMSQHFQKINGQSWTWDMNYPGYDRPTAGTYNSAVNGNWQLVMTPELVSAWRQDNSRSLWSSGYAYDGRYLGGNTYLSASESFNTKSSNSNSGSTTMNGSKSAGTLSSNTNANTSGLNNNASANSSTANQMNGNTSSTSAPTNNNANPSAGVGSSGGSVITNGGTTGNSTSASTEVSGSTTTTGSGSTLGTLNGNTNLNATGSTMTNMDANSISYNAANGNMYQLPKFNLYLDNGSFTGYTGCNSVSGRVSVSGNSLRFLNTEPSTNIDCLGGLDQTVLIDLLRRVDSYSYVGDELQLMQGNQVLLRFKKNATGTTLQ